VARLKQTVQFLPPDGLIGVLMVLRSSLMAKPLGPTRLLRPRLELTVHSYRVGWQQGSQCLGLHQLTLHSKLEQENVSKICLIIFHRVRKG